MADIFLRIADTAIMAGIAVLAVLLLRLIFGRTSSAVKCAMWAVVALRLILLFPIESRYAILPAISVKEMIGERIGEAGKVGGNDEASVTAENNAAPANAENSAGHSVEDTDIDKGYSESADISAVYPDNIVTGKEEREPGSDNDLPIEMNARGDSFSAAEYSSDKAVTDPSSVELRSDSGSEFESMISEQAGPSETDTEIISADDLSRKTHTGVDTAGLLSAAGYIWLAGVIAFLCYAAYSSIRLRSRLKTAVRMDGQQDVYMSEYAASPFVFGILHPVIYMGFGVSGTDAGNVIAHERMHIRRKDHLFKLLSFVLLAFYWFVPWVWAAYYLYCRDMELACDEAVIRDLDGEKRAEYSETLLTFALNRHNRIFCPISFGEIGIRARIKNILKYKKRSVWIAGAAIVVCAAAAVVLFLTPDKDGGSPDEDAAIELSGDGLTSAADSSVDTDPIDSRITEPAPTGIADDSTDPAPTDAAKEPAVQDDAVPVYDPKSGIDVGAILDEYAALHIKAAWQPDLVKRIAFLENDGVIVAVYINARPGGKTDIGSENGIYSIPYSVGCDFYAVTYSENRGECIDCRFVLSSAAVTSGYGQTFALIPAEGGVLWVNVLPNDFGWVERTSAQIWFLSEGGAKRYKFSDTEDDHIWWRTHTAALESDKKLVISESDTDEEYFEKIINEAEEKLRNNTTGYVPTGYSAINWSEATAIDLEQLAASAGDVCRSVLDPGNLTDQDALALAAEYFEKNLGYVNRYGTIVGAERAEDGRNLIVLKVLGMSDDVQSVMVIGCDDALENREYAYYIGTSASFERDGIGLKAYVTASWQGSPLKVVFDGYIGAGGLVGRDISGSLYEQIRGEYLLAGGAGRWSNYLELKGDGSFTGKYAAKSADPDNPETDISYICEYSGLLGNAVKISDHIYSAQVTKLVYPEPEKKYEENGIKYITCTPRGLEKSDEILIFLPGCSVSDIPGEALRSFNGPMDKTRFLVDGRFAIFAIYSVNDKEGFDYWNYPGSDMEEAGRQQPEAKKELVISIPVSTEQDTPGTVYYEYAHNSCYGPSSFCISDDAIYILDTNNFRVAVVYKNSSKNEIEYIELEGIVESPGNIVVIDGDICVLDQQSKITHIFSENYELKATPEKYLFSTLIHVYENHPEFRDDDNKYDVRKFIAPYRDGYLFLLSEPIRGNATILGDIMLVYSLDAETITAKYNYPMTGVDVAYVPSKLVKVYNDTIYVMECYDDALRIYRLTFVLE